MRIGMSVRRRGTSRSGLGPHASSPTPLRSARAYPTRAPTVWSAWAPCLSSDSVRCFAACRWPCRG